MSYWTELRMPTERELLVGFYDLAGYMRYAEKTEPQELLATMAGYFALTGRLIGEAGGRLIKTLGDAGLVAFPAEAVDAGVQAMRSLQAAGREWLASHTYRTNIIVKLHLGPVAIGRVGSPGEEIVDVYGKTVNVAAALPSAGLAMTPAVFRSLRPETPQALQEAHAADQLHRRRRSATAVTRTGRHHIYYEGRCAHWSTLASPRSGNSMSGRSSRSARGRP